MYKQEKVAAVVVAAGNSTRMGFDKLLFPLHGKAVLLLSLQALANNQYVDYVTVVVGANRPRVEEILAQNPLGKPCVLVQGGKTRMESVLAGIKASADAGLIAIHDGARPFVSDKLICKGIELAAKKGGAAPGIAVKDTIKRVEAGNVADTPRRSELRAIQTPQVFVRDVYNKALLALKPEEYEEVTDDCMVLEKAGMPVAIFEGDEGNYKITTPADLPGKEKETEAMRPRIGHGYDVHRLVEGRDLIIGGVNIPYEKGLLGHSDADVLLHAITDALFGSIAMGDIGTHFPDTDPAYKGADSLRLLQQAGNILKEKGYEVGNIDATVLCQMPKLKPHIPLMVQKIASALEMDVQAVSIKATTEEKLGFTGSGEGISAHCVAMVYPL